MSIFTNTPELYIGSIVLGVVIALLWLVLILIVWGVQELWAWIDESEVRQRNILIKFTMTKLLGYECSDGSWNYVKKVGYGRNDGEEAVFTPMVWLFCTPFVLLLSVQFYPITIGLILATALAHLTRYVRRNHKLFKKHVADKNAHDKQEEK